jgi:SNF2 family DNA or RNA helicase
MTEHIKCPVCDKIAVEVSQIHLSKETLIKLRCGHVMKQSKIQAEPAPIALPEFKSKSGKVPFPFQDETIKFIFDSGGRCLVAHEQGLGKTVCALAAMAKAKSMLPALVACKSNLSIQWMKQSIDWLPGDVFPQIIETSKDFILPNMHLYIISYDLLRRMPEKFFEREFTTVILDEVQHIKSTTSARTDKVRHICRNAKHIIGLSGTPIKNHAGEYFTILNLLKPERFPSKEYYYHNFVDTYWNGRAFAVGGLRDPEWFREKTKDFIIRYEQKEVLPDLPALKRNFQYFDIDKVMRDAYNKQVKELQDFLDEHEDSAYSFANYSAVIAYITKMRQITGISKVGPTVEYLEEHLENTDQKVIVFLHHHIARNLMFKALDARGIKYLAITESDNADKKDKIKREFMTGDVRVIILGTLSSGEGIDGLQEACSRMIVMERQWNPANEEQAEKRLHRIGQANPVDVDYPIALGTIDEFFTELVEKKRQWCKETYGDSEQVKWNETDIIKDLVSSITTIRGGKKWALA